MGLNVGLNFHLRINNWFTYIIKTKKANPAQRICPYKNDITNNLKSQKPVIYSRYRNHLLMVFTHYTWQQSYILIFRTMVPKNQGFLQEFLW